MLTLSVCEGLDVRCEACQRFFRDGLTISFTKILTDEAVSGWKFEIHVSLTCFSCDPSDLDFKCFINDCLSSRCRGASSTTPTA